MMFDHLPVWLRHSKAFRFVEMMYCEQILFYHSSELNFTGYLVVQSAVLIAIHIRNFKGILNVYKTFIFNLFSPC